MDAAFSSAARPVMSIGRPLESVFQISFKFQEAWTPFYVFLLYTDDSNNSIGLALPEGWGVELTHLCFILGCHHQATE